MKIDKLRHVFKCDYCDQIFEEPIILPCGNKICKKDLSELLISEQKLKCVFCNEEHKEPVEGFPLDQHLQNLLDLNINQLEFGPIYNSGKRHLKKLIEKFKEVDLIRNDPQNYIYNYFSDLRIQVELRREEMKNKIDDYSNEIIESIDKFEKECRETSQKIDELTRELEVSKQTLNKLIQEFDSFDINDKKSSDITYKANELKPKLHSQLHKLKQNLLNNKSYIFKMTELSVDKIFGTLMCSELVFVC